MFKHDATLDFVTRIKKKDQKLIERGNFEVCGGSTLEIQYALFCNVLIYCILEDELSLGAFAL